MVVQASPQISAAQVLDAGRRAEADGRVEYADQFYRHLADHHSGAPEAAAARDALSRLKRRSSGPPELATSSRAVEPPPLRSPGRRGQLETQRGEQKTARNPMRIAPAGAPSMTAQLEMPESVQGYLTGRLIAHGFAAVGGLLVLAGLLAAAMAAMMPGELAARLPDWLTPHPLAGPVAVLAGIVLVFWGQLASAVFDIAKSSRDIAAIERAKAEHANAAIR